MHLNIFVSNTCFIYCKGCYSYSREEKPNNIQSSDIILDFLKYARNKGIKKVTICGGDPLIRSDIIELLEEIKSYGYSISLDTIGTPLIGDVVINNKVICKKINPGKLAQLVDMIGIPIDGSTNEIIDKFRHIDYDYIKSVKLICNELSKNNAHICINTVVHKGNIDDTSKLALLVKNIGHIDKWQLFQFAPLGRYGFLNRNLFEISSTDFDKFEENIKNDMKNTGVEINFKKSTDRIKSYMLIDNSGNAWIPSFEKNKSGYDNGRSRSIIGNITNHDDWDKICKYIK